MLELDKKIEVRIAALGHAVSLYKIKFMETEDILMYANTFEQYILRGYNEDKAERDQASS